jgi:hypothetical protein
MLSGWVLADLYGTVLTMKIKLRCTKSTILGTLTLENGKDPDPYQTVGSKSISN